MKPITMYAVYSPEHGIISHSVRDTLWGAKRSLMGDFTKSWEELAAHHKYRLITVDVTFNPTKPL